MKFYMPPPNAENLELYQVVDPTNNLRILVDDAQPYIGWYNPSDFEVYLQFHNDTVRVLEEVYSSGWRHDMRKKLRSQIRKVFIGSYRNYLQAVFLERFQKFWIENPNYPGGYREYTIQDLEWKFVENPQQPDEVIRAPFPLETPERLKALRSQQFRQENKLDRYLPLITEWAMASFSQCRDEWMYVSTGVPLNINSFPEADYSSSSRSSVGTPISPMLKKLRQITKRLEREGKIDPSVLEILE